MLHRCLRLSFGTWLLLAVVAACGGESSRKPSNSDENNAGTGGNGAGGSSAGTGGSSAGTGGSSAGTGGSMQVSGAGGGKANPRDDTCSASITFRVTSPTPATKCVSSCGLTPQIIDSNGDQVSLGDCSTRRCGKCANAGCPAIACIGVPLRPEGLDAHWGGNYQAESTCNGDTACHVNRCAEPGSYVARFCSWAPENGACPDYSADLKCTEVTFDFPGDGTNPEPIEVVLD